MKQLERRLERIHRERGAGPLAKAHIKVKDGPHSHPLQRRGMAAFRRSMAEEQVLEQARRDTLGGGCGGSCDEPVDDHRNTQRRASHAYPSHRRDFESTDRGKDRPAINERGAMQIERALDDTDLAAYSGVIKTGSAPS